MHTIKNKFLQVSVKEIGAELCSIKSVNSGKEYVWQANPEVWSSHAPNLFPVIGCLKDNGFLYNGQEYKCPKHGFVRNNENVKLVDRTENSLTFRLVYSEDSLKIYPFKFEFNIKYLLEENKLNVEHIIVNKGDNPMLFSLGGHPGFNCPVNADESYNDYFLEFQEAETAETWRVQKDGLIGKETVPVFDEPKIINLHAHLFDEDALIFKNLNSKKVSLKSRKSKQVLSMIFNDFPYLGIWAKPKADYVCIEPWIGIADSVDTDRNFEAKEGLVLLGSKQSTAAIYTILIEE
ncbi:MAG: aldose 1-epimerase family protein [Draconibacterium sp.]|nr:aldose 1-epimerase family protein [Draconibacterium sp.]